MAEKRVRAMTPAEVYETVMTDSEKAAYDWLETMRWDAKEQKDRIAAYNTQDVLLRLIRRDAEARQ